jgi:hypothetical protein
VVSFLCFQCQQATFHLSDLSSIVVSPSEHSWGKFYTFKDLSD